MKRIVLLDNAVVYNKQVIPWDVIQELLLTVSDDKTVTKLMKKFNDRIHFESIQPDKNFEEIAKVLGVNPGQNLVNRVYKKIDAINASLEQPCSTD